MPSCRSNCIFSDYFLLKFINHFISVKRDSKNGGLSLRRAFKIVAIFILAISLVLAFMPTLDEMSPIKQANAQAVDMGNGYCQDQSTGTVCPCCYDGYGYPYLCCGSDTGYVSGGYVPYGGGGYYGGRGYVGGVRRVGGAGFVGGGVRGGGGFVGGGVRGGDVRGGGMRSAGGGMRRGRR